MAPGMLRRIPWKFVLPALMVGALLVIAALAAIGPAVGNVFSGVTSQLAYAPTPSASERSAVSPRKLAAVPSYTPRLIVYTVDMSLVVRDAEEALAQVEGVVAEMGGYVVSSSVQQYEEGSRASVTVRVSSEELDRALDQLRELALEVRSERKSGEDVTEEYVDLNARLEILKAAEQELLALYETRRGSGEVADILEVYRQLTTFRQDIEALTGRIQYLEQSAAMAKVTIELIPDVLAQPIEIGGWRPAGTARAALQALISGLQFLADALIWLAIVILPLAVVIGIPGYGLWRLIRRWRARRGSTDDR